MNHCVLLDKFKLRIIFRLTFQSSACHQLLLLLFTIYCYSIKTILNISFLHHLCSYSIFLSLILFNNFNRFSDTQSPAHSSVFDHLLSLSIVWKWCSQNCKVKMAILSAAERKKKTSSSLEMGKKNNLKIKVHNCEFITFFAQFENIQLLYGDPRAVAFIFSYFRLVCVCVCEKICFFIFHCHCERYSAEERKSMSQKGMQWLVFWNLEWNNSLCN